MTDPQEPLATPQDAPGPSAQGREPRRATRRSAFQRQAVGGLLGAAALLGLGQLWARFGGS
jgi:hypothetical protein